MQTILVYEKSTKEVIACLPLDGSEGIKRKDIEIEVYNGSKPVFLEKDGYIAVDTNAFILDLGRE